MTGKTAGQKPPCGCRNTFLPQGVCSRRRGEVLIREGRTYAVNGQWSRELGTRVDPEQDRVAADGVPVRLSQEPPVTIALHKPRKG
jgi:23S rRNA pseudouridine2605 synthase